MLVKTAFIYFKTLIRKQIKKQKKVIKLILKFT